LPPSKGPKDEGSINPRAQSCQRFANHVAKPHGFHNQLLKFMKHGASAIGLKIDLPPLAASDDQTSAFQVEEFSLNGPVAPAQDASQFAQVQHSSWVAEENP